MTDRMNPTDQATQLTQESEEVLERIWTLNGRSFPLATREDFRAIEAAAARRATEGSGVVEALEAISRMTLRPLPERHVVDPVAWYRHMLSSVGATADATLAALPRPEGPRDDVTGRCDGCHHAPHAGRCEGSTGWGRCACATALPHPEEPRVEHTPECGGRLVCCSCHLFQDRPEEPRVDRCAWRTRVVRHAHDESCKEGDDHVTDMFCHPFTPEAR